MVKFTAAALLLLLAVAGVTAQGDAPVHEYNALGQRMVFIVSTASAYALHKTSIKVPRWGPPKWQREFICLPCCASFVRSLALDDA